MIVRGCEQFYSGGTYCEKIRIILADDHTIIRTGLRIILDQVKDFKVVILGVDDTEEYVYQLFSTGALGYLLKKSAQTDLVNAIRIVSRGGSFLSPAISENSVLEYIVRTQDFHCDDKSDFLTKCTEMCCG